MKAKPETRNTDIVKTQDLNHFDFENNEPIYLDYSNINSLNCPESLRNTSLKRTISSIVIALLLIISIGIMSEFIFQSYDILYKFICLIILVYIIKKNIDLSILLSLSLMRENTLNDD